MCCIIVDTSSILFGFSRHIDIFERISEEMPVCKVLISKGIINELEGLSKSKKNSAFATVAIAAIKAHKPEISESAGYVDSWILSESAKRKCRVCTNDTVLKRRLRNAGVSVISLSMGGRLR